MFLLPAPFAQVFDPEPTAKQRRMRGHRGDLAVRRPDPRDAAVGERV